MTLLVLPVLPSRPSPCWRGSATSATRGRGPGGRCRHPRSATSPCMYVVSCAQKIATLPTPIARASLSSSQAVDSRVGHYLCQSRLHVLGNGIPFVCLPQVMRETTPFQRLLLVQTLRPDRLVTAMQTFATEALGVPTITPNPVSLGTIVEEVRADCCFFFPTHAPPPPHYHHHSQDACMPHHHHPRANEHMHALTTTAMPHHHTHQHVPR